MTVARGKGKKAAQNGAISQDSKPVTKRATKGASVKPRAPIQPIDMKRVKEQKEEKRVYASGLSEVRETAVEASYVTGVRMSKYDIFYHQLAVLQETHAGLSFDEQIRLANDFCGESQEMNVLLNRLMQFKKREQ